MKRVLLMLALAGLGGAPLLAQDSGEKPNAEKTREELLADLHKLMKKASSEMEATETKLAKSSLAAPKADVVSERIRKLREAMTQGKLDGLPEGLREYLAEHPEEATRLTGKSEDELRKLAEDPKKLEELLNGSPDLLKKLAASEATFEEILKRQVEAEKRLEESLRAAEDATERAKENIDGSIDIAHELKSRSS